MNRFKYTAALEISSEEVRFGVSRISYTTKSFMIVHKSRFQGKWFEKDQIINKDQIIALLKKSISEFEIKFRTKLEYISLVLPDFSSRMQQTHETINYPERKVLSPLDFESLISKTKKKYTNDHELAIKVQSKNIEVDGMAVPNARNFNKVGSQISSTFFVTIINREIFKDHASIIEACEKKVGQLKTTSLAHSEVLMGDAKSEISVILNWMNKKVVISIHVNGILIKVSEWTQGVDNIAEMISKATNGMKIEFIKSYMYKMLEVNRELPMDNRVVMRRGKNHAKTEVTSKEFKEMVIKYLSYMIQSIDKLLQNFGLKSNNMKMYHVGKISKFARYEEIIKQFSLYKENLAFPKIDVFGANENWTQIIVGMMLVDAKKTLRMKQLEEERKEIELMKTKYVGVMPQHQYQQPQYRQQPGYYQQPQSQPMNMRMVQKTFIK
jgi:cell division ATPase FtsA